MKDIANILDGMKDDQALLFLNDEDKERIVELGVITHQDPKALEILFKKFKMKGNPNSRFGFLSFEDDNFIGLMKYKNTLILIANKEYVSPRLLMRGLCTIITIIYDHKENVDINNYYFSDITAQDFKLTGLNAKILSKIPNFVLSKMSLQNGIHTYQTSNLKITHDDNDNISHFKYMQKYKAEPLYEVIEKMCRFNPELAIPASFINAKKFNEFIDGDLVKKLSDFEYEKVGWERLKLEGWEVRIDDFPPMNLSFFNIGSSDNYRKSRTTYVGEDYFVFDWKIERDEGNKRLYVYPKYKLKGEYLLYTSDEDFENNEAFKRIDPFQREIAFTARNIFGNFIPQFYSDRNPDYFSSLTMSQTGRIVEDENNIHRIPGIDYDITTEADFIDYYNFLSSSSTVITPTKVLKRTLK